MTRQCPFLFNILQKPNAKRQKIIITIVSIPTICIVNQITIADVINTCHVSKDELVLIYFLNMHNRVSKHLNKTGTIHSKRRKLSGYIGHNLQAFLTAAIWWRENYTNCQLLSFLINKPSIFFFPPSIFYAIVFNKHIFSGTISITEWLSSDLRINYPP